MLTNSILVLNSKGGVLKTSLTAQIAGITALSGWRVLAVDLDQQGNLARDLGCMSRSDGGAGLYNAVTKGERLQPVREVRPNLDVVPGGPELLKLHRHLTLQSSQLADRFTLLRNALEPLEADYNLVVIDAPPGGDVVQYEAMSASRFVVIPTQPDQASIDGLASVFRTLTEVQQGPNPSIEVLGVVLGPIAAAATRLRADTIEKLRAVTKDRIHVFTTIVRAAQSVAVDCRERGLLVYEYELDAVSAPPWYKIPPEERAKQRGFSSAASGLADDYQELVAEILQRFFAQRWTEDPVLL